MIYVIHFDILNNVSNDSFLNVHIFESSKTREILLKELKEYSQAEYGIKPDIYLNLSSEQLRNSRFKLYELNEFIKARNITLTSLDSLSVPDIL